MLCYTPTIRSQAENELAMAASREFRLPNPTLHQKDYDKWQRSIEFLLNSGAVDTLDAVAKVINGTTAISDTAGFIDGIRPGVTLRTEPKDTPARYYARFTTDGIVQYGYLEGIISETRKLSVIGLESSLLLETVVKQSKFRADNHPEAIGWDVTHFNNDNEIVTSLNTASARMQLVEIMIKRGLAEQSAIPQLRAVLLG